MNNSAHKTRKAQFFIITTVFIAGSLLFMATMFTSTADIDYTDVLSRHDTDIVKNTADQMQDTWWHTKWRFRTSVTVQERNGTYLANQSVPIILPAQRRHVKSDCSDIRIVDDGNTVPWTPTTNCSIETYDSDSTAVARYKLDEGHGQWANDSTGNGHHGIVGGSISQQSSDPSWDAGRYGYGLSFDGNDDYTTTSEFDSSPSQGTYTYWAFFPDPGDGQDTSSRTIQTGFPSSTPDIGISHEVNPGGAGNDVLKIVHWSGGTADPVGNIDIQLNTWNYIAHVIRGDAATVYLNGEPVLSGSADRDAGSASLTMGAGDSNHWNGRLDDIRIYNRPLQPDRIKGIYQNGIGLNISTSLAPEEQKTLQIYHGNIFAEHPEYHPALLQQRSLASPPEVISVDPTRTQEESFQNLERGIKQLDERIASTIEVDRDNIECPQITFRSSLSHLRKTVCLGENATE